MAALLTKLTFGIISVGVLSLGSLIYADTLLLGDDHAKTEVPFVDLVVNYGVHGELFAIAEEDMIEVLMRRLSQLKESGKLEVFQQEFQEKARKSVLEPKTVPHITPTTHERVFYVDPTLIIEGDIVLPEGISHAGHVLAKQGDLLNPLHTLKPHKGLLVIDGDDDVQQQFGGENAQPCDIGLGKG